MEKKKPTQDELLKAVADVLDEAILQYESLTKGDGIDNAEHVDDMKGQGKGIVGEPASGLKSPLQKEGAAPEPVKEEDKKDKDEDEDDDKLMATYKSLMVKMEKRGLMQKMEKKEEKKEMKKSEAVEAPKTDASESLRKSFDDRFESLTKANETLAKTIKDVAETVKKIASTPAQPRKGLTGYTPLKKNDGEAPALKKGDIVNKLIDLKKNNTAGVDSLLINRVETGRMLQGDMERLKALNILGE